MDAQTAIRLTPDQLTTFLQAGWDLTRPVQDFTIAEAAEHLTRHDPRGLHLSDPRYPMTEDRLRDLLYAAFTLVGVANWYDALDGIAQYLTDLVNDPDPRDASLLVETLEEEGGFEEHEALEIVQGITGFPLVEGDR